LKEINTADNYDNAGEVSLMPVTAKLLLLLLFTVIALSGGLRGSC